jgi:hypothetical protein
LQNDCLVGVKAEKNKKTQVKTNLYFLSTLFLLILKLLTPMVDIFPHSPQRTVQAKKRLCCTHCINMEQRGLGKNREANFRILQT